MRLTIGSQRIHEVFATEDVYNFRWFQITRSDWWRVTERDLSCSNMPSAAVFGQLMFDFSLYENHRRRLRKSRCRKYMEPSSAY